MSEILKQITVDVASSPKTHVAVLGFFSSPFWLNWGEPLIDGAGKIVSLGILILLFIKHFRDLKKDSKKDSKK